MLQPFLILSAVLFAIGIFGVLTRRSLLGVFMSIEIMFNAANLNFVAFNRFMHPGNVSGQGFAVFVITLAAAEAVVGLSLVLAIYRNVHTIETDHINILHG